ncbi:tetratricopeptide repeat protein [Salinimicrobium sp. TH3]|uniref:tetratricopeptide repeat protein n=1 Tax=Salinimicrobium sp. TH3 TaxID=2997342 RepID=UPI0022764105|nr:tetratricopeptide repeat protein [Salinimicrobium sp. TH3]MCY2686798.1 tetratricopeptide repeat protein [Salinimicrobium sp. TH3]
MRKILPVLILLIATQHLLSQTAEELNSQGIELAKKGNIEEAFLVFDKAIDIYPDSPGPYSNRGNIYRMRKEYSLAINDFSKSLELYPENLNVRYARANTYLDSEDFQMAISDYTKIIEEKPSFPDIYFDRAYANIRLENYKDAKTDLESQLAVNPKDFKSLANLINLKTKMKLFDEALEDYEKIFDQYPNQPNLHILYNNRATLYQDVNENQKALEDINIALKINRNYDIGFLNRAGINLKLGNKKQACKDFEKALKLGVKKHDHFKIDEDFEKLAKNCE